MKGELDSGRGEKATASQSFQHYRCMCLCNMYKMQHYYGL